MEHVNVVDVPVGDCKPLMTQDEKDDLRRFRNRHHARATRERKKLRLEALAIEYDVLKRTGARFRHHLKSRLSAMILLNLGVSTPSDVNLMSVMECTEAIDPVPFCPGGGGSEWENGAKKRGVSLPDTVKQEIRRERNKMHAKATRERKKAFLEAMELAILVVERENGVLMGLLGGDTKDSVAGTIVIEMAQVKADQLKILYGEDEVEEAVYTGWEAAAQAAVEETSEGARKRVKREEGASTGSSLASQPIQRKVKAEVMATVDVMKTMMGENPETSGVAYETDLLQNGLLENALLYRNVIDSEVGCVAPVYAAPVYAAPVYAAPVYAAPVYAAPVNAAPVNAAPVYCAAPVHAAPAHVASTPISTPTSTPQAVLSNGLGLNDVVNIEALLQAQTQQPLAPPGVMLTGVDTTALYKLSGSGGGSSVEGGSGVVSDSGRSDEGESPHIKGVGSGALVSSTGSEASCGGEEVMELS